MGSVPEGEIRELKSTAPTLPKTKLLRNPAINDAFARGAISETDYETRDTRLRACQAEIKAWREETPGKPRLPLLAPPRRPLRADLEVRVNRRRAQA